MQWFVSIARAYARKIAGHYRGGLSVKIVTPHIPLIMAINLLSTAALAGYEEVSPKTSPFRLPGVLTLDIPALAWHHHEHMRSVDFTCHLATWNGDAYIVEATYCFADYEGIRTKGGWEHATPREIFGDYYALEDVRNYVSAPSITTAMGAARVFRFNAFYDVPGDYHCVGLIVEAERTGRFFKKTLDAYICNNGNWPLTVDTAVSVLRHMSLGAEFGSLIP
jgi:hypothetical protein